MNRSGRNSEASATVAEDEQQRRSINILHNIFILLISGQDHGPEKVP